MSKPNLEKLLKYRSNARKAIKDLLRRNEMITALWNKEIALNARLRSEHRDDHQKLFRFAEWVFPKLMIPIQEPGTWRYSKEVSIWLHKWETEIDQRPEEKDEQAPTKESYDVGKSTRIGRT